MPQALSGSVMGLIGYGSLARRVATAAEAFGMSVPVADRKGAAQLRSGRAPFTGVLSQSNVLVVLCPLTDETRGMIGPA